MLSKYNIYIVPVSISSERIFDSKLFADEILSNKANDYNLASLLKLVYDMPTGKLGKTFVKYGDAILLNDYYAKH
jgi:glycerol-3-phosphate O-acyltransferase